MKYHFIFCHGWGFNYTFFKFLIDEYFSNVTCYCLDLGYFGKKNLNLPNQNNVYIGIGHSLGFIKLISLNIEFKAIIGIQAFTNFLGFNLDLHKRRKFELNAMIRQFQINPIDTLMSFHKRCGTDYNISNHFNTVQLMKDLQSLTTVHALPNIPILILGAMNDIVVPVELIYDNFGNDFKVTVFNKGYHCLGLYERNFVYQQIVSFLNGIK